MKILIGLLVFVMLTGCFKSDEEISKKPVVFEKDAGKNDAKIDLTDMIPKLEPLHAKMPETKSGDWLDRHHEPGQTFAQYLKAKPVTIDEKRKILYIQPLGDFSKTQWKIVKLVAEYMSIFFNAKAEIREKLDLSVIPKDKRRIHFGNLQLLSTYILHDVLYESLPDDAAVYLCFTAIDLFPDPEWNFVFGQANTRTRCGVWSINRFGNPDESEDTYKLCLKRTLATATHETGHMFTIRHCIKWKCNMNGSNSMRESDSRDVWLCPECLAKVCWATGASPIKRYEKLAQFCKKNGLTRESEFFTKSAKTLK